MGLDVDRQGDEDTGCTDVIWSPTTARLGHMTHLLTLSERSVRFCIFMVVSVVRSKAGLEKPFCLTESQCDRM